VRRIVASPTTKTQVESWIPQIKDGVLQAPVIPDGNNTFTALSNVTSFNRILDDAARRQYGQVVEKLFEIIPDMMKHKIREANIQQAFVLDTVYRFATRLSSPKILCIGSYNDTAAASLKKLGFGMDEVDPVLNYDLNAFIHKPTTVKESYNVIFSTSVIEHVKNDELFISQIVELLAPEGIAVLTCDYNDQYKPGDKLPKEDFRFYTQNDFRQRLFPLLINCSLLDEPHWNCPTPDFHYSGCAYTFATFVFKKNRL
jgi:SAM-dependent methyltransferase